VITGAGRRRHSPIGEKLRIVGETLDPGASTPVIARRNGVAPNLPRIVGAV
jgi:transposase-like protein